MNTLVLGLAIIVAAPAPKEAKKPEPTILGEWSLESAVFMGMPLPAPKGRNTINFTPDGKCITFAGDVATAETASFTHDAKKSPAEIDLIEGKGMTMKGIYKIEGETLTICIAIDGQRPDKFGANDKFMMMTLKRMKKE